MLKIKYVRFWGKIWGLIYGYLIVRRWEKVGEENVDWYSNWEVVFFLKCLDWGCFEERIFLKYLS